MSIWLITLNTIAQINVPQDTVRIDLSDIYVEIATVNAWQLQSVPDDTVMYITSEKPFFITQEQVNNYIKANANIYTSPRHIGNIYYEPVSKIRYKILRSGKVVLEQQIKRSNIGVIDKSNNQKIWFYLKYAKINNYPVNALWSYPQVDSIINPPITVVDTIIN